MTRWLKLFFLFIFIAIPLDIAQAKMLMGVNLSGGEFGSISGKYGWNYIYPRASEMNYFAKNGATVIRLPILWGRIQPLPYGPLNADEVARLKLQIQNAKLNGLKIVLDIHNYGHYAGGIVGTTQPAAVFIDLWTKLAVLYKDEPDAVVLGLMNEPHQVASSVWFPVTQDTITAIRETGAKNTILVPAVSWSGAHAFGNGDRSAFLKINDPLNNIALELHQYFDSGYSGTHSGCKEKTIVDTVFDNANNSLIKWARMNKVKLFLGEFGVANNPTCLATLSYMLQFMQTNNDVFYGWTYWSAGPWWGDYMFSVEPDAKTGEKPQMPYLRAAMQGEKNEILEVNFAQLGLHTSHSYKHNVSLSPDGKAVTIGNDTEIGRLAYTITSKTVVEFDVQTTEPLADFTGLALIQNANIASKTRAHTFQIAGKLNYSNKLYRVAPNQLSHIRIEIGKFYTGAMDSLLLLNEGGGPVTFSNLKIAEAE